jgi:hypothetical protein
MKILAILGGTLGAGDLAIPYAKVVPKLLQQGLENVRTPFADHEISVVLAEEAINAYFKQLPDRIMFVGTLAEKGGETPTFILLYKMLTREMDKKKFLFTNPITVPPFNTEENFFVITDTDKMAEWLEL